MLIDRSYFIGEINIPNTHLPQVGENLDWFIEKYEPKFLRILMGYDFYQAFIDGISQVTVEQRWNDIVFGKDRWTGLIDSPNSTIHINYSLSINIVVGRGGQYDPVDGSVSVNIPAQLVDKSFIIELRGVGQLRPDEYTITGNVFTWTGGKTFQNGETLFYHVPNHSFSIIAAVPSLVKKSMIANYVYWFWSADQLTQTVGLGEGRTKAENSVIVSPSKKMVRAWNENSAGICQFFEFMNSNRVAYPEWNNSHEHAAFYHFHNVNVMNV